MLVEYFTNKGIEQGEVLASLKIAHAMLKKGLEWTVVEEMTSVTKEQYDEWVKP